MGFLRWLNRFLTGRRLEAALHENQHAADKLDAAIKELMDQ